MPSIKKENKHIKIIEQYNNQKIMKKLLKQLTEIVISYFQKLLSS